MHEILFQYGFITFKTFHLVLAITFLVGVLFLIKFIQRKKMKITFLVNHFIHFLVIPLIGGRIFYIIEQFNFIKNNPLSALTLWDFNFSPFGIFYSFVLALYFFAHRNKEDFWSWLDAFVLTGLACLILIHIGHFFNGTYYGTITDQPWGITFDAFNIPFLKPIHPTQLYSAFATFLIFSFLMRFVRRTHLTGMAGNLGLMLYSISAFGIDFFHGAPSNYARINYALVTAIAFIFYIHCSHRKLLSATD